MEVLDRIETQLLTANDIELAGTLLRVGDLVAIPTETVYGLGANGLAADAMDRIYTAKGRPSDNPLILHVCDQSMVHRLVKHISPLEQRLMDTFWPGPLTITFEKSALVPERATGGLSRVALRCPDHEVCREMIRIAGVPIAAPSANRSGRPSPTTAEAVLHDMKGRIHAIVDAGPCEIGVESTVVQVEDDTVIILRPGGVTKEMLEMVADQVIYDTALHDPTEAPKAPGMKYRHYAPDMPVQVLVGGSLAVAESIKNIVEEIWQEQDNIYDKFEKRIGLLLSEETLENLNAVIPNFTLSVDIIVYGEHAEPTALANRLYDSLLQFNDIGVDTLLVEGCAPVGLGVAVMNRLEKASGGHVQLV